MLIYKLEKSLLLPLILLTIFRIKNDAAKEKMRSII